MTDAGTAVAMVPDIAAPPAAEWVAIAPLAALPIDRGVAALVDGVPVAVFRLADGTLAAIDHIEPFTGTPVLARGLVGSVGDTPTVASPLHKQRFDLLTGRCLDAEGVAVRVWPVELRDGVVHVANRDAPTTRCAPDRPGRETSE
jgi:nitrite reductase (NADH) small subunit